MCSPTNWQVHENDGKKPLQQSKSKVTSSFQRLIESIDYVLITKGGERNEPIILK
jgi:hypothetical protein